MLRGRVAIVVLGGVVLGLVSCSSSPSDTDGSSASTPGATTPIAVSTPASTPIVGDTIPVLTPSATTGDTIPVTTTTTAPGRVVNEPNDNVRLGDSGPGVKQIQTALNTHGFAVATDGDFGPKTEKAVKAFQKASAIKQDGIVGPVTWSKLQAAPSATTTSTTA